jgi:hypothetical protein
MKWEIKTTTVTCQCGAVYERHYMELPAREQGSFECPCCGSTLERWNSGCSLTFRLIKKPETPEQSGSTQGNRKGVGK